MTSRSWGCAHGVERRRADRGCKARRGWHQRRRATSRQVLGERKVRIDHLVAARGRERCPDPWAARDADIDVVLDRTEDPVPRSLHTHGLRTSARIRSEMPSGASRCSGTRC